MTEHTQLELAWTAPEESDALPHPTKERWEPLRIGLVDLFYYDDEQFWFHDGRLLLRGNNGTGKSKVLALTLPFLLDGSVQARRVEPDADPKKRMEWNLLLGGAHASSERTGYTWVEFGRVDSDGVEQFITLGIGLKAAAGRGLIKTWYFTTTRRIGDLRLMGADRVVLTAERLREAIGATGAVHPTQEAYRRAVDEALFKLGPDRYGALIDLLVQLRQPQLSKRPDEKALSAALTEALAPLDQAIVADVAESFRSLEEERDGIAQARETFDAAEEFLKHYRAYAAVAARRHTTAVREANSRYEHAGRDLREAEADLVAAGEEDARLAGIHTELAARRSALDGEQSALKESPAMREATALDAAGRAAEDKANQASGADVEARRARAAAGREADLERTAAAAVEAASDEFRLRSGEASRLAVEAGLEAEHPAIGSSEETARREVNRRRDQVKHVRGLVDAAAEAAGRATAARRTLDQAEGEEGRRREQVGAAEKAVELAVSGYLAATDGYLAGLGAILVDADAVAGPAEAWARSLDGDSPVRATVEVAADTALEEFARHRASAESDVSAFEAELTGVRGEIATLEAGHDPDPAPAPGRDRAARENRAGAPLWRVTDFGDAVAPADRAGLEAALTSAGLLDAWVFPDGTLSVSGDVVLGPGGDGVGRSLGSALTAAIGPDEQVSAAAVSAVLGRIGVGEGSGAALWIDIDGTWGAGPARGSFAKERAEFIGAGARESYRRELIATLRTRAEEIQERLVSARAQVEAAISAAAAISMEKAAYPAATERDLVSAHQRAAVAAEELTRARQTVAEAGAAHDLAAAAAGEAAEELAAEAADLALGITVAALDETLAALSGYEVALVGVRAATRALQGAEEARTRAAERAGEAASLAVEREEDAAVLRTESASLQARFESLQATVGASVAELQSELARVESAIRTVGIELATNEKERIAAAGRKGSLEQKVSGLEARRVELAERREEEILALRSFTATGLLRVALPGQDTPDAGVAEDWNVTAAVGLARSVETQLDADESEQAWARAQQRLSNAITTLTSQMSRHGHTASVEPRGDVLVARVRYRGDELGVDRLAEQLAADVADRERLLSAKEREILENHLVNEVAGHLHELLVTAQGQMERMNRELASRRTSTGMQLRVQWKERADGPAGLAATRNLMMRSDATWTKKDREAIGDFLQAQINEVRLADPTGGWAEHLEKALDYRSWHIFTVERLQNGVWKSASGPSSGGEKVLAVSVPLFAAASAHYNSAGPHAPRLILLDEAFAGVDDDSRAKSLGLLATFDLDVVMTSEREWGCYPQVPGLSIAQLSRVDGLDAVGVTRWRWDGRRRSRVDEVDDGARAGGVLPATPDADDTLFPG